MGDVAARANVALRDIVDFFVAAGIQQRSVDMLNGLIDSKKSVDFLSLTENYGKSMAFINHDDLCAKLSTAWGLVLDQLTAERKAMLKKIKLLREDKKTDPDYLVRQENLLSDLESRKCTAVMESARFRPMQTVSLEQFKNPNFDPWPQYQAALEAKKSEGKKR